MYGGFRGRRAAASPTASSPRRGPPASAPRRARDRRRSASGGSAPRSATSAGAAPTAARARPRANAGRSCPRRRTAGGVLLGVASRRRRRSSSRGWSSPGPGTSGGRSSWCSRPSTSPTDHTMASSTGLPPWVRETRWAVTVRPGAQRGDVDLDRPERGDGEVVAVEAGGTRLPALRPRGPEGDGGDVPAAGPPDLPVRTRATPGTGHRRDPRPPCRGRGHPRAARDSQSARCSSITVTSSPLSVARPASLSANPRCSITRPDGTFSGS